MAKNKKIVYDPEYFPLAKDPDSYLERLAIEGKMPKCNWPPDGGIPKLRKNLVHTSPFDFDYIVNKALPKKAGKR